MKLKQQLTWILCSKKMPPAQKTVLAAIGSKHVFVARYYRSIKGEVDFWSFEDGSSFCGVTPTHWMAFPLSPFEIAEKKRVPQKKKNLLKTSGEAT
jgi:hypothetical protein